MNRAATARIPASSANLGPGFDVLGLALSLFNDIEMHCEGLRKAVDHGKAEDINLSISVQGEGEKELPRDKSNLSFRSALKIFERLQVFPERMSIILRNRIPLKSGLGSSGAVIVGAMLAADSVCCGKLEQGEMLKMAAEIEGHGDNVAASMLGGLSAYIGEEKGPSAFRLSLRDRYKAIVATPHIGLSTNEARARLPHQVSREDVVFSLSRVALLCGLLASGGDKGIEAAMRDRIHQPYRAELVRGLDEVIDAALKAGALGAALSGAGPSIIALIRKEDDARKITQDIDSAFKELSISSRIRVLSIDRRGARVKRIQYKKPYPQTSFLNV